MSVVPVAWDRIEQLATTHVLHLLPLVLNNAVQPPLPCSRSKASVLSISCISKSTRGSLSSPPQW